MKTLDVFVALLRGVNVGGNNMIKMRALKVSFQKLGFTEVSTYINSGNIIFKSKETDARKLERNIEQMLVKEYRLESKVVVRSLAEMETLVNSLPKTWNGDSSRRYNVIFLRHTIDSEEMIADLLFTTDVEETFYRPGVLFWTSSVLTDLNRTQFQKLSARKFFQDMTIRNLNTTKKLHDLMKKTAQNEN